MSHYLPLLIIAHFLVATNSCTAMHEDPTYYYGHMLFLKKPRSAQFLTNNLAIINHDDGCGIFNLITKKEIKKFAATKFLHVALHPDKKKVALSHGRFITLYDRETGKKEWTKQLSSQINSSTFNPLNKTILIYNEHHLYSYYDYESNDYISLPHHLYEATASVVTFHPTQPLLCQVLNWSTLYIHKHEENTFSIEKNFSTNAFNLFCEYSPNGALIVTGNPDKIILLDPCSGQQRHLPTTDKYIYRIIFHPDSSIITTLSEESGTISYWNVETLALIGTTSLPSYTNKGLLHPSLSFSPDGTQLLVALPEQNLCVIVPVPFDIINEQIYASGTKEKAPLVYWLLKNYKDSQGIPLPGDITQLLVYTLLEACKR